ncbi:TIGR04255 family protein [Aliidiomarina minuta]|uniref:TIGR04255 family protein n=1 Tax=Aliidiomarina minuta TaxID=880057 RepID=A0A432W3K6_9GAMM|nr:TIGR04255 family protein [Aliidiomarina minuta]RUO23917.1 TIGR04255 family protein [Aliidiomarina minuta]
MTDYRKLENQPLKLVLAEFRFSQVLQIEEYIPKLQEELRKQYPTFRKSTEQSIHVKADGLEVSSISRWSFTSSDKKNAIDISQDRLVYFTTAYPRFEGFSEACANAIKKVLEIVEPSLLLRIGLRYCDLITIDETEQFINLVDEKFLPTPITEGIGKTRHLKTENYINTQQGTLSIRSWFGEMPLTCPPDIDNVPVQIQRDAVSSERLILDFDHVWEAGDDSIEFSCEQALDKLDALHDASRAAFWKATKDYARETKWM